MGLIRILSLGIVVALTGSALADGRLSPQGGTITSVGATSGMGLTGGGTGGPVYLGLMPCGVNGQVLAWSGSGWACATPSGGGGSVASVTATTGGGIVIGGTGTAPTVGLLPSCATNQILKWSGTAWACAADVDTNSGGTVTSIASGFGLTGGPITGAGTLAVDTSTVQARVTGSCSGANSIQSITSGGAVGCTSGVLNTANLGGTLNRLLKVTGTNTGGDSLWSDTGTATNYNGTAFTLTTAGVAAFLSTLTADGGNRVFDLPGTGMSRNGTNANQLDLGNTAVSPGSYAYGSFTVDQQGRLTAASSGTTPVTPTGSPTANKLAVFKSSGTIGPGLASDDGIVLRIDNATVSGWYFDVSESSMNCGYADTGSQTCKINARGNANGFGTSRNLEIDDGQAAAIASFGAVGKTTSLFGLLTANSGIASTGTAGQSGIAASNAVGGAAGTFTASGANAGNTAVFINASGGTANTAIDQRQGDNFFNSTSGSTTFSRALIMKGDQQDAGGTSFTCTSGCTVTTSGTMGGTVTATAATMVIAGIGSSGGTMRCWVDSQSATKGVTKAYAGNQLTVGSAVTSTVYDFGCTKH